MKYLVYLFLAVVVVSCTTMKLSVPDVFKAQATEYYVTGAKKNKMSFAAYSTSRIKRGIHLRYPGWGHLFIPENLLLNYIGLAKDESIIKEKAGFRYSISDGHNTMKVMGQEREMTRSYEYRLLNKSLVFNQYSRLQEYRYIFSAVLATDTAAGSEHWELVMSNSYEREKDTVNSLFTIIRPDESGMATNGADSIFIKPVMLKNTEGPRGQKGVLPIKMLGGYELSNRDGVIVIIDLISGNVWLYNELDEKERLIIAGITTALFARKINSTKW